MKLEIDKIADAAYVRLTERSIKSTKELDDQRRVDYDGDGEIVGIEFLTISQGVDLADLPHRDRLADLFGEHHVPVFAA